MGKKLSVGNLTYGVTAAMLQRLFAAHGAVLSVQVVMDPDTGRSRGFGFVEMGSDEEARAATAALTGRQVDGRGLTIHEPRPKAARRCWNPAGPESRPLTPPAAPQRLQDPDRGDERRAGKAPDGGA